MKRRTIAFTLIAACTAGMACSPVVGHAAGSPVSRLVLTVHDLPSGLGVFHSAPPSALGMPGGGPSPSTVSHSTKGAHGFQASSGSFLINVQRPARGILLIDDGVLRFSGSSGSHWYLGQTKAGEDLMHQKVNSAHVGDESIYWTEAGAKGTHFVFVFWRHGQYVGDVTTAARGPAQVAATLALARIADAKLG